MHLLLNWLVTTAAILIAGYLLPGVEIRNFFTAVITALVLGLINAIIRPLLIILTLPLTVVTLGLFIFIINAFLVLVTSAIVPGFTVQGFSWALLFSLVFSTVSFVLHKIVPA